MKLLFVTALHLGFHHVEPWPCAIFMKLLFCHGPPSWIWPSRASTLCIIHEVILLSPSSILHLTTQSLDPVQHPWGYSFLSQPSILDFTMQSLNPVQCTWGLFFVAARHLGCHHAKPRTDAMFMRWFFCHACHLGFHHVKPQPDAIYMRFVFCHGPPSWISPRNYITWKIPACSTGLDNSSPVVANRAENSCPG